MNREEIYKTIEMGDSKRSRLGAVYDVVMLVMIIISIVPLAFREQNQLFVWFDRVSVAMFVVDYLLRWYTADIKLNYKRRWLNFVAYPFTFMAILDLLSILPSLGLFGRTFKMFRVIRLMKIARVFKLFRYSKHIQILFNVLKREKYVLLTVLGVSVFYIFVTALIMFNVEMGESSDGHIIFNTFFDAVYWATVTLTTVGYGDIYPVSEFGRIVSMLSSLFGVAVIALPSGVITASYLDELREWKKHNNKHPKE